MTTITKVCDRNFIKAIRPEIEAALAAVGAKYGVEIRAERGVFSNADTFSLKLEGNIVGGLDKHGKYLEMAKGAGWMEVPKEWQVGTVVKYGPQTLTIKGMNSTLTKVLAEKPSGVTYLYPLEAFIKHAKVCA